MSNDEMKSNMSTAVVNINGFITPEEKGAVGDGVTDDRIAIQSAIDEAYQNAISGSGPTTVWAGSNYLVSLNPQSPVIPGEMSAGRGVLCMKSGVTLTGGGQLLLVDTYSGTSPGAVISNWDGNANNITIKNITIDCRYDVTSGRGISGINIVDSDNVLIDGVSIKNSTGGGVYLRHSRGNSLNENYGCTNSRIVNCIVNNAYYIGIQCERPGGMVISSNVIVNTRDNGIDIEGNNSATTGSGYAENVIISGNTLSMVKNGVFLESCGNANVVNNQIITSGVGVIFNRINSASYYNVCSQNKITGLNVSSGYGIRLNNQIGRCQVSDNFIRVMNVGIHFVDRIDRCNIGVNTFDSIGNTILSFSKVPSGVSVLRSSISEQIYLGTQTGGIPYPTSPRGCPSNYPNRMSPSVRYNPVFFTDTTGSGEDNMLYRTAKLTWNESWGAYSKYNIAGGYTEINGIFGVAGDYVNINDIIYIIASVSQSTTTVNKWSAQQSSYIAGDFTSEINDSYTVNTYRSAWGEL
ncbi:TPA: right-handed parallel beta-helix repeat-containing protein [Klebsiella aerogenes]|nr:right-handed parallel beta-helix repeat-containing protein [Klebsiella aerogenes]HDU5811533.1 right-handed parallel beta-helix repeat-containing protein [Klebsiella aerogenes]